MQITRHLAALAAALMAGAKVGQAVNPGAIQGPRWHGFRRAGGLKHVIGPSRHLGSKGPSRRDWHRMDVRQRREHARLSCPPGMSLERHMQERGL